MSLLEQASLVLVPSGYKEDIVYSQIPTNGDGDLTFTRASDATRVNSAGLIEKVRTNFLLQSNTFSNAAWGVIGTPTLTANYDTNPLTGANDAWRFQSASGSDRIFQAISGSNSAFSLYAKGSGIIRIQDSSSTYNANLTLTSSWQRVSLHIPASFTNVQITSNGGCDATIYAAQLETGDIATDYIETTTTAVSVGMTANVPRLDYSGGGCPKLLLEPQRTNALLNSVGGGTYYDTFGTVAVTNNYTTAPDGTTTATRLNASGVWRYRNNGSTSLLANTTYTFSLWVKSNTTGNQTFRMYLYNANFSSDFTATANWQRFTFTSTSSATVTQIHGIASDTSNNASDISVWGWQIEQGEYPTSYIPTLGTSVTRVADACYKTGISSLIGQTEGTLFVEFNHDISVTASLDSRIQLSDGTTSNWIFMGIPDGGTKLLRMYVNSSSGTLSFFSSSSVIQGVNKAAFGYKSGDFVAYLNGTQVATNTTSHIIPPCSRIDLQGGGPGVVSVERENINQALLFQTRLTNDELAQLTTL